MQRIELRTGVYSTSLSLASTGALVLWPGAPLIAGSLFAAAAALAIWGVQYKGVGLPETLRGKRARQIAYAERVEFEEEVVYVNKLVNDAVPAVVGKQFKKCIIRGSARLCFDGQFIMLFPLASEYPLVKVPDGADITGAVRFINVVFDRCFFEDVFLELDPANYAKLSATLQLHPYAYWKQTRNYRGPRK